MRRLSEALEQLVPQQRKAGGLLRALAVVLRGTHHKATHHRKGAAPAFHKHLTTLKAMGKVERLRGCFHPIRKVFGFLSNVLQADQDGGRLLAASAMPPELPSTFLSHLNAAGEVHMVEVGERPATRREARAEGLIVMRPEVLALVLEGRAPKGDVLAVARVAAIQAAKRTWELIPLCHPIALSGVEVAIEPSADGSGLRLEASARTTGSTGVEMEALTAVQVGLLTLYDMLKSADPAMTISGVRLLSKSGGRHGDWQCDD
jgi:cyclic pyranopterin phosphate synthase